MFNPLVAFTMFRPRDAKRPRKAMGGPAPVGPATQVPPGAEPRPTDANRAAPHKLVPRIRGLGPLCIAMLAVAAQSIGQVVEWPGSRAPIHGVGAVERRALSLGVDEPAWAAAAVRGVPPRERPLAVPASVAGGPQQIGVNSRPPRGPIEPGKSGTLTLEGAERVWRVRIDAPGSSATRLWFTGLDLPQGTSIVVAGRGVGYVISGRGALGTGTEWTPVLVGESAHVEVRGPAALSIPRIAIEEVAEITGPWPAHGGVTDEMPCQVDVMCESVEATARDSVGLLVYSTGGITFACTGALLNDADPLTDAGWLLTSNRCISTAGAAASLTAYWFYQSPACNGVAPNPETLPISQGATLIVSAQSSDASLLRLAQDPSQGQGLAGWSGNEPAGTLTTIHHPLGTKKRIALGLITTATPICFGQLGVYQFHYLKYTHGITELGSAGAPLFNSSWQVVGQLFGPCALETPTCSNPTQWNAVFGRFSRTLPLLSLYLAGQVSPDRVYVDAAATGAGSGESWTNAYPSLATALADARPPSTGMEIWVARGTYTPAGTDRESSFQMVNNVKLYGGFAGNETILAQRNVVANPTVLSGDLAGDDGANFTFRSDNVYHVVRGSGVDSSAVLDGFTIRGGQADGPSPFNDCGGGLYIEGSSPRIRNCTFTDNLGGFGGGAIGCYIGGTVDVEACAFDNNLAAFGGAVSMTGSGGLIASCLFEYNTSLFGGGALLAYESTPTISGCSFLHNLSHVRGGAVSLFTSTPVAFETCRFERNTAMLGGGAVNAQFSGSTFHGCIFLANSALQYGGAFLQASNSHTTLNACRLLGNTSGAQGGGVHANSGSLALLNCELSGNSAVLAGGGVWHNEGCHTTLLNSTLAGNIAGTEGGGAAFDGGSTTVTNTVFFGNRDSQAGGQHGQVRLLAGAGVAFGHSLIEGWTGSLGGTGNIGGSPLFVSPLGLDGIAGTEDDDLSLGAGSPAIDAGNTRAALLLATDLRGNARRQDDPCSKDRGTGPAPMVDMGAIEATSCTCYANCDGSTTSPLLTANDFQCFLNAFATGAAYANCDGTTVEPLLTANDFLCFVNAYAAGCSR